MNDIYFIIIMLCLVAIFLGRLLIWYKIKDLVSDIPKQHDYFSDLNAESFMKNIPDRLKLKGKAKQHARIFNRLTIIAVMFFLANFILIVVEKIKY